MSRPASKAALARGAVWAGAACLWPALAWAQAASAPSAAASSAWPASSAPSAAASAPAPPSAAAGRRLYASYCTRCHGINLVVTGSAFFDLRTFPRDGKERFLNSVAKGVRAMPAWEATLKPHEIESLWLYVGSVNGW